MLTPVNEVQLQWNEPLFFTFRTLGWRGLLVRSLVFPVLIVLFSIALFAEPESVRGARGPLVGGVLVVLSSAVLTFLLAAPSIQRRITISRDGISWGNLYPASIWLFVFALGALSRPEMKRVLLQAPKEAGNRFPYGIMTVELKYATPARFAVPNELALEKVAQVLRDNGVAVELLGAEASSIPAGAGHEPTT